ncbi:hypothetical protein GCM10009834_30370 [Streptomonospora arabica]
MRATTREANSNRKARLERSGPRSSTSPGTWALLRIRAVGRRALRAAPAAPDRRRRRARARGRTPGSFAGHVSGRVDGGGGRAPLPQAGSRRAGARGRLRGRRDAPADRAVHSGGVRMSIACFRPL